ncbi:MAG: RNA polymerase sigma factor [Cytophagales bacterium]|nr:RNA polymerase sigma factor [Cytophagales bacterium]
MTEKELVDQCQKEIRSAQKALYETYYIEMKRLVMRYAKEENDAFDCLSTGFYKVLTKINQFDYQGKGSLSAWIRKIMINEALMKIKALKREQLLFWEEPIEAPEVQEEFMESSYIYDCIRLLPDGARTIFNLVAIEGYSHKEASQILNISEGTSRSQLVYARGKLKQLLNDQKYS